MLKNKDLLLLLTRLFLGYIFFSAGICKLTGGEFGQLIGPPWLEAALAKHGLGLFAQVVAVSQAVCGLLLLSQRFSLLGAVMLVPMNVAILAVTVSQKWVGTPYVNTVFLLLNLMLLWHEKDKFRFLLQADRSYHISPTATAHIGQSYFSWLGIGFSFLTIVTAPFSLVLTNSFAMLALAVFALTLIRSSRFQKLDILLLTLPFAAMVLVTMFKHIPYAELLTGGVLLLEALLLPVRLYLGVRSYNASAATAVVPG